MEMDRTGFLCSHSIKNATVYFKSFESESCGKQFFEGKNMIGNIFEKKILLENLKKVTYMRTCHTRKHGRVTEESLCGATS